MQCLILLYELLCTALGKFRILSSVLGNLEAGTVRHIIAENVQYEAFLNSLTHTVYMERVERAVGIGLTEHFKSLSLGSCGKCKEGQVLMLTVGYHLLHYLIGAVDLVLGFAFYLRILTEHRLCICKGCFIAELPV